MNIKKNIIYKIYRKIAKLPREAKSLINRDRIILDNPDRKAVENQVNLQWYSECRLDGKENIGDYLGVPIFHYMLERFSICQDKDVGKTKHLYTVGSIIFFGHQNATIWGSGLLCKPKFLFPKPKLDIRAVRGPNTRRELLKLGYECPEVYGDPGILMPLVYTPNCINKTKEYGVIYHKAVTLSVDNRIAIMDTDYRQVINQIVSCKLIISSSLHGIILAEAYGVPAILLKDNRTDFSLFKYEDYYYSTGRTTFPVVSSIEEALHTIPANIPELNQMRKQLLEVFPKDLWE